MKLTGLAPLLVVPDVGATLEHYRDRLGFEGEAYEADPDAYAYVRRDERELHFACGDRPSTNHEVVPPDLFDVYLWVDDVEGLHDDLRERGADILLGPTTQEYGMREIRVRDLNGHILAFGRRA